MNSILAQIRRRSRRVDRIFKLHSPDAVTFHVPSNHRRFAGIPTYVVRSGDISAIPRDGTFWIVDERLRGSLSWLTLPSLVFIEASERFTKTDTWVKAFLARHGTALASAHIVAVGGGVVMNVGAAIAMAGDSALTLAPTSVIAMADASSGGKVRLNYVGGGRLVKHGVREFYEPDRVILDPRFLRSLDAQQVADGLPEIIKHAVWQSPFLCNFLLRHREAILRAGKELFRAIMWSAALKAVCLQIDPTESREGSGKILRSGHDISDAIEEVSHLSIPHGIAVAFGLRLAAKDRGVAQRLMALFDAFQIPYSASSVAARATNHAAVQTFLHELELNSVSTLNHLQAA